MTGCVLHPGYRDHLTGPSHPESPQRLAAIEKHLKKEGFLDRLLLISPRLAEEEWILTNHTPTYLRFLQEMTPREGKVSLDADTPISPSSYRVARLAVGGLLEAVDRVMEGVVRNAFCAIRPPGHHAEADRAMGFCLFNNVAIAARYLQKKYGVEKVLIVDWDVHHGNGTQNAFYEDPTVLYFSVHQFPHYPGTGRKGERGQGAGEGYTLNCPLPIGCGDEEYQKVFEEIGEPVVLSFRPDFILVSAGFDAHRDDPLAGMNLTEEGFGELTRIVKRWADTLCGGRVISALEGGYHLPALARSVEEHLLVLNEG